MNEIHLDDTYFGEGNELAKLITQNASHSHRSVATPTHRCNIRNLDRCVVFGDQHN